MLAKLIRRVAEALDQAEIPYMIIGGQAVLLYGRPRLTRDIDITLGIDTDDFLRLSSVCGELDLRILPESPLDFVQRTRVLPAEEPESRIRVDFIFSFSEYERQAIDRAKQVAMDDYPVRFASCEDIIIHKMVASRAVDIEDVRHLLVKNRQQLDYDYLRHWLSEFSALPEYEQILESFEHLLKE
ncbi:MAG: nucleotidyl transferase AbiEii/AbiGii toxin family protein [Solirubrobacterales bacterium]